MILSKHDDVVETRPDNFIVPALRLFSLVVLAPDGTSSDTIYISAHAYFIDANQNLIFKDMDSDGRIWHRRTIKEGVWRDVEEVASVQPGTRMN